MVFSFLNDAEEFDLKIFVKEDEKSHHIFFDEFFFNYISINKNKTGYF